MTDFQPLEITAALPFGIAAGRPWGLSLDGLLASVLWHRAKAAAAATDTPLIYDPTATPVDLDLPLARCTLGDTWHWMATFANTHPATEHPDVRLRTRRTDHRDLQRLSPHVSSTVSDVRGRYRNRTTPTLATITATATWRAVGDLDAIDELLGELTAIGKHRHTGEGAVTGWTLTLLDVSEWSAGHEHTPGVLGRTTPLDCVTGHGDITHGGIATIAVRAPYIHPSRHTTAYLTAH